MHENATTAKSDVTLPLETHAEKDGTVTHPDGRLQRVRPSASRPENVLPNIIVLSELAANLGLTTGIDSQPTAFKALTSAVSFYNGITDEQIGGRGIRWQDLNRAPRVDSPDTQREAPTTTAEPPLRSPAESRPPSPPSVPPRPRTAPSCSARTETSGPAQ